MGMFDRVVCRVPIYAKDGKIEPAHPEDDPFQSKDMECDLSVYTIQPWGALTRRAFTYEGDQTAPDEPTKYTGEMYFRDMERHFKATFENGHLLTIVRES